MFHLGETQLRIESVAMTKIMSAGRVGAELYEVVFAPKLVGNIR